MQAGQRVCKCHRDRTHHGPVSYTHLDVYKRQEYDNRPEALLAAMGTAPAEVVVCDTVAGGTVSYTHLDVYKRQGQDGENDD